MFFGRLLLDKNFPLTQAAIKNCLAAELTSTVDTLALDLNTNGIYILIAVSVLE